MPQICYVSKLLDMYLWEKYANVHATYEVVPISDVARITVQG